MWFQWKCALFVLWVGTVWQIHTNLVQIISNNEKNQAELFQRSTTYIRKPDKLWTPKMQRYRFRCFCKYDKYFAIEESLLPDLHTTLCHLVSMVRLILISMNWNCQDKCLQWWYRIPCFIFSSVIISYQPFFLIFDFLRKLTRSFPLEFYANYWFCQKLADNPVVCWLFSKDALRFHQQIHDLCHSM